VVPYKGGRFRIFVSSVTKTKPKLVDQAFVGNHFRFLTDQAECAGLSSTALEHSASANQIPAIDESKDLMPSGNELRPINIRSSKMTPELYQLFYRYVEAFGDFVIRDSDLAEFCEDRTQRRSRHAFVVRDLIELR
jgi:hypothetical protein